MFLSKVTFQQSHQTVGELAKLTTNGPYASHQLLWELFTQDSERQFLFRQETAANGLPEYYVLSNTAPVVSSSYLNVQSKLFSPKLEEGQRLAFKLRVNPTICVTDSTGRSKRHDVLMHAKQRAKSAGKASGISRELMEQAAQSWFSEPHRLEQWGIALDLLPDIERYTQHRSRKKSGHDVQFSSVDFQGVLTVADPSRFLAQYSKGFGRSKSLGCGLMLIRPV